jgi:hypothetical protein
MNWSPPNKPLLQPAFPIWTEREADPTCESTLDRDSELVENFAHAYVEKASEALHGELLVRLQKMDPVPPNYPFARGI